MVPGKGDARNDLTGHSFGVIPYLPLPRRLRVFAADLEADEVRRDPDRMIDLSLTDQEFALFRNIRSGDDVHVLAADYGWLGIGNAARDVRRDDPRSWPLWFRGLSRDPEPLGIGYFGGEPVTDWVRQSGLLDLAYGLLGLRHDPAARGVLVKQTAPTGRSSRQWPALSVTDGARRAGLRPHVEEDPPQVIFFPWRRPSWQPQGFGPLRVDLSARGIDRALRGLLNPWLGRIPAQLVEARGKTVAGLSMPMDLLGLLWLQLANAYLSRVRPRLCAWKRCPGPPTRPGVFLWRWGTGVKHRDAQFCTPRCKAAKTQADHRRSPAAERGKK